MAEHSYLGWCLVAIGLRYGLLLGLSAIATFVLTLVVVVRGKGATAAIALVFIVPVPMLVGMFAALASTLDSFAVIAMSDNVQIKSSELYGAICESIVRAVAGMLLMAPSYLVAMFGTIVRSQTNSSHPTGT